MKIHTLQSNISDNVLYIVEDDGDALLVDPFDAKQIIGFVREQSFERVRVFTTHGHPDHVGGNETVKSELGCEVIASRHGTIFDVPADSKVGDGDTVTVGSTEFQIRHAPGHTDGHIVAFADGHLISGDVYFVGGAGHCKFGGDEAELHRTFSERLADLPDDTVFYPGHDYAEKNHAFCVEVEPENRVAIERLADLKEGKIEAPVLATLGEERSYNPFHRTGEDALQEHLAGKYADAWTAASGDASEKAFRVLRGLRDKY